jgi:predicted DNA-binding transcriptional regulator YafY
MEALAFLHASFPAGTGLPEQAGLRELIDRIVLLFPPARREQHWRQRSAMTLQLVGNAPGQIDPAVLATLKRAIQRQQELVFDYRGLADGDTPRRHRVAPYGLFFRPEGHGYLDATLLEATPRGREPVYAAIDYRLDRIVPGSAKVLPQHLLPERVSPPSYVLRYKLLPSVARRRDVASYFPDTRISYQDDGSALVSATTTNLWQTRQILLRYGAGCLVLDPPELVAMVRETVQELVELYTEHDERAEHAQ